MPEVPAHPYIDPEQELNDTALVIDAILAPVQQWLDRLCCGDDSDGEDVMHGHAHALEAARQIARYVATSIDEQNVQRRQEPPD